jgi:hypothetical protein
MDGKADSSSSFVRSDRTLKRLSCPDPFSCQPFGTARMWSGSRRWSARRSTRGVMVPTTPKLIPSSGGPAMSRDVAVEPLALTLHRAEAVSKRVTGLGT